MSGSGNGGNPVNKLFITYFRGWISRGKTVENDQVDEFSPRAIGIEITLALLPKRVAEFGFNAINELSTTITWISRIITKTEKYAGSQRGRISPT